MNIHGLIQNANRIGQFFEAQPDRDEALAGLAEHLKKFWEPGMRTQILAALGTGDEAAMREIVVEALTRHRDMLQPQA